MSRPADGHAAGRRRPGVVDAHGGRIRAPGAIAAVKTWRATLPRFGATAPAAVAGSGDALALPGGREGVVLEHGERLGRCGFADESGLFGVTALFG